MKSIALLLTAFCLSLASFAQKPVYRPLRVLFLGNSYTYVNGMPSIVKDIAASMGDMLTVDSNTIGGYMLQQHASNATSLGKIMQGNWDYTVLQEQSQWPSFPIDQVDTGVFPYAHFLDSFNHAYNACGRTMFYMTWGYKDGDAGNCPTWPPVCTYTGMDSILRLRYMMMADSNNAVLSPAGAVRRYIRLNYPTIELYQADGSHPTPAGSYAVACCFYTALFRKDPSLIPYNYSLSATDAANIRTAAKAVVYDSMMYWHIGEYDPAAHFSYTAVAGYVVTFTNTSSNAASYTWYFGDGDSSTMVSPTHSYGGPGIFNVMLVAHSCNTNDTINLSINTWPTGLANTSNSVHEISLYPNPVDNHLSLSSELFLDKKYDIRIFDATGRAVYKQTSSVKKYQSLDIPALPLGWYMLEIADGMHTIYRQQFIKAGS